MPYALKTLSRRGSKTLLTPGYSTHELSAAKRGYGYRHRQWRAWVINHHSVCKPLNESERRAGIGCGARSSEADHIIAVSKGGDPFAHDNGWGRCSTCHAKKMRLENRE